jgi:putative intracellular protease/amidase
MSSLHVLMVVTSHGQIDNVPTTGIWFTEFSEPYALLAGAGVAVTVASPLGGAAPVDPRGYPSKEQIAEVRDALARLNATLPLEGITHSPYDALFLPGGHGPMFDLATDPRIKQLVADFWEVGKPVAAVCHGPASLLNVVLPGGTTLLKGKRVTGFSHAEDAVDALFSHMPFSLQARMTQEGADFIEGAPKQPHVEVDGRLVTGQNPASATVTAEAFLKVLNSPSA